MTQQQTSPQISATDPLNALSKPQGQQVPPLPPGDYDVQITVRVRDWTKAGSHGEAVAMAEDKIEKVFPNASVDVISVSVAKFVA
jgi:hypothetical protein